jgi:hypothetical protein
VPPPPPSVAASPAASLAASVLASRAASVAASPAASPAASVAASLPASFAPASFSARKTQSGFDLQPVVQAVPAQYWPRGQLSLDGKHCTQVSLVVSHHGVAPWHCEFTVHCTHDCETHCSPVGHGCVGLHPGTHEFVLQTMPGAQSLLVRHATQVLSVTLQRGVGAMQLVSCRHATQMFVVVSHTVPVGHVLIASHPVPHVLFTQRWLFPQSAEVRHATHEVCASHFCPTGQSALVPHTWQAPLTQTCPVVLVPQSLLVLHPPDVPSLPPASPAAPSPPPIEASSPPGPMIGLPLLEHPAGKKTVDKSIVTSANAASKRRSRPIRSKLAVFQGRETGFFRRNVSHGCPGGAEPTSPSLERRHEMGHSSPFEA